MKKFLIPIIARIITLIYSVIIITPLFICKPINENAIENDYGWGVELYITVLIFVMFQAYVEKIHRTVKRWLKLEYYKFNITIDNEDIF